VKCGADFYAFAADQNQNPDQNPDPDSRFETRDESPFSGQMT